MRVGIVREIKDGEGRVALTPSLTAEIVAVGSEVLVERDAGHQARFSDEDYARAGATIVSEAAEIWSSANLVLKVKEPQESEYDHMRSGQTLMAYLHVAGNRPLARSLLARGITAIALERVEDEDGYRPILEPMLEIAGAMGMIHAFAHSASTSGGRGKVPGAVAGIAPARVRILGTNTMAFQAARTAQALGAHVFLLDPDVRRLQQVRELLPGVATLVSHTDVIARSAAEADILVNTFPWAPGRPGYLITREHVRSMKPRALLVDLAADDPGAVETSRPTSLADPLYEEEGVLHYCVPNVASAVARSSTRALANAVMPYMRRVLEFGPRPALRVEGTLRRALVTMDGHITDGETADWYGTSAGRPAMILGMEN